MRITKENKVLGLCKYYLKIDKENITNSFIDFIEITYEVEYCNKPHFIKLTIKDINQSLSNEVVFTENQNNLINYCLNNKNDLMTKLQEFVFNLYLEFYENFSMWDDDLDEEPPMPYIYNSLQLRNLVNYFYLTIENDFANQLICTINSPFMVDLIDIDISIKNGKINKLSSNYNYEQEFPV